MLAISEVKLKPVHVEIQKVGLHDKLENGIKVESEREKVRAVIRQDADKSKRTHFLEKVGKLF